MPKPAFQPVPHSGELLQDLRDYHQRPGGRVTVGERLSAVIIGKDQSSLRAFVDKIGNEDGKTLIDCLLAAEDSLRARTQMVTAALARLCIAAGLGGPHG